MSLGPDPRAPGAEEDQSGKVPVGRSTAGGEAGEVSLVVLGTWANAQAENAITGRSLSNGWKNRGDIEEVGCLVVFWCVFFIRSLLEYD
jgi:hypothetical protein